MKPGKALMICYAVVLTTLNSMAQSTPVTLKQCIETALANNMDVKLSDLNMQRARVNWKQGKDNLLPSVGANVGHNLNSGRSLDPNTNSYVNQSLTSATWGASADLTLFNGLRWFNNMKATQYAYEASRMELQQQKDNTTLDVVLAYLDVLTNQDLLVQIQKQVDVSQKQVERLEIMNKEGAIKPSELFDLQGLLGNNKVSLINAQNNLNRSKLALQQLMNVPSRKDFEVQKMTAEQFAMDYNISSDSVYQTALQQMAIVKATELRQKSAGKYVQSARGALFPTVGLGAGINSQFSSIEKDANNTKVSYYDQIRNNYRTYVGIGVSIPILNAFQARNRVTLNKIDEQSAEYTVQTTKIQLKQNIERDHNNMEASLNRYQALVGQVTALTASFKAAEVRFEAGASTSVEYLVVKNNLDAANTNLIIARYDYVLRTKILDYYQAKTQW